MEVYDYDLGPLPCGAGGWWGSKYPRCEGTRTFTARAGGAYGVIREACGGIAVKGLSWTSRLSGERISALLCEECMRSYLGPMVRETGS